MKIANEITPEKKPSQLMVSRTLSFISKLNLCSIRLFKPVTPSAILDKSPIVESAVYALPIVPLITIAASITQEPRYVSPC